jgi:hypothetical protein
VTSLPATTGTPRPRTLLCCRGRSPGSRVSALVLAFPRSCDLSDTDRTSARRSQLRGQRRNHLQKGSPASLLARNQTGSRTTTSISSDDSYLSHKWSCRALGGCTQCQQLFDNRPASCESAGQLAKSRPTGLSDAQFRGRQPLEHRCGKRRGHSMGVRNALSEIGSTLHLKVVISLETAAR